MFDNQTFSSSYYCIINFFYNFAHQNSQDLVIRGRGSREAEREEKAQRMQMKSADGAESAPSKATICGILRVVCVNDINN